MDEELALNICSEAAPPSKSRTKQKQKRGYCSRRKHRATKQQAEPDTHAAAQQGHARRQPVQSASPASPRCARSPERADPDGDSSDEGPIDEHDAELIRTLVATFKGRDPVTPDPGPAAAEQKDGGEDGDSQKLDAPGRPKRRPKEAHEDRGQPGPKRARYARPQITRAAQNQPKAKSFEELGISQELAAHLNTMGVGQPTAIQSATLPVLLAGSDAIVRAPTGTGKTLAYLLPVVQRLGMQAPKISRAEGCHALIITPTRELTTQVYSVADQLVKRFVWLVPGQLIGGENRHHEKQRLRKGVVILVATPGRLLDHLQCTTSFVTANLQWLLLDEADRLLDMGFQPTIASIVQLLESRAGSSAADWQAALVSATLHPKLGSIAADVLRNPVAIGLDIETDATGKVTFKEARTAADTFEIPAQLKQLYVDVPVKLRLPVLIGTIRLCFARTTDCKMVVFVTTCPSVEFLFDVMLRAHQLAFGRLPVEGEICRLHGDMSALERSESMAAFRGCVRGVLICTDVAARGIDFPKVTHILQYDPPGEVAEYVQRIGRTARMGRRGVAVLFLAPAELGYRDLLGDAGVAMAQQQLLPALSHLGSTDSEAEDGGGQGADGRRAFQLALDAAQRFQGELMKAVEGDKRLRERARTAFQAFVRAYATHPHALKAIFHVKKLHLGHVAHSFALTASPKRLGSSHKASNKLSGKGKHAQIRKRR